MGFRVGRSRAQHVYPESRGVTTLVFARNFAQGPSETTAVTMAGVQVPWTSIESVGGSPPPGTVDVPITPRVTGRVRLLAMVAVQNTSGAAAKVSVQAQVGGVTVVGAPLGTETVDATTGVETVPYVFDLTLPVGTTSDIELLVSASADGALALIPSSTTLDIQELPRATG